MFRLPQIAAGCLLLCLWVAPRMRGRHTRSGYRSLQKSREMLAPAYASPPLRDATVNQLSARNVVPQQYTNYTECTILTVSFFCCRAQLCGMYHVVCVVQIAPTA